MPEQKMKLLFSGASPFARKVRVLALELGIADRIEEVAVVTTPVAPAGEVTDVNPISKIPTLVTPSGEALYDSRVICEYLLSLDTAGKMKPANEAARWTTLRRQALADGILDAGLAYRYEKALRPAELHWSTWLDAQKAKVNRGLAAMAADLPSVGGQPGLDAIAAASALGWIEFRLPEITWRTDHPALHAFFEAMSARPSMAATKP